MPAVAAAAVLSSPVLAAVGEDAELRELWSKYVAQLEAYDKTRAILSERRKPYDAEYDALSASVVNEGDGNLGRLHETLWKKHGIEPFSAASNREGCKLRRIVKAIRKANAESLFGIGVKLSVVEGQDDIGEVDLAESIDDARQAIAELTGVDFAAATGSMIEAIWA